MQPYKAIRMIGLALVFVAFLSSVCLSNEKNAETSQSNITDKTPEGVLVAETNVPLIFDDEEETVEASDPFKPIIKPWKSASTGDEPGEIECPKIHSKRLTPLEFIPLEQLQLKGVVLSERGNHALIEDSSGKPYVIHMGTKVGTNWGIVKKISKRELTIEEKFTGDDCKIISKERTLKLPDRPST